jgi:hypothetical protein
MLSFEPLVSLKFAVKKGRKRISKLERIFFVLATLRRLPPKKIILLVLLFSICSLCFISIFITPPWGDEKDSHYPNALNISLDQILKKDSNYSSAYPPFPYILGSIFLKIYRSLFTLRLLNYMLFLASIFVFFKICKKICTEPISITALFLLNPYLLRSSYSYYMFHYGLTFALGGIYFYFFSDTKMRMLWAHLLWMLAVLSQQWMLIVIIGVYLSDLSKFINKTESISEIIKSTVFKFLSLAPALLLFYVWKGLTHPNFHEYALHASLEHLNSVLANIGLLFLVVSVFRVRSLINIKYLPLLFLLPILFFSVPVHSERLGLETSTGVAAQLCDKLRVFLHVPYNLSMSLFILSGIILFMIAINIDRRTDYQQSLFNIFCGLCCAFVISALLGASHIYVSIPFLLLMMHKEIEKSSAISRLLIGQFYLLSIFYTIYITFFRSSGLTL